MPKVLSAIYSYEDMKEKWNQDNPNPDGPYNRYSRRDELQQGVYELDKWLIRVDDEGKTIATIGWKEYPSHTVVGGLLATNRANKKRPEFEGDHLARNERALQSAREPQMNQSKPLVAAFGAREGSPEEWIERGRSRGWIFSQDENFNQVSGLLPEQVINEWNTAYPNGNWAIRPITDAANLAKWVFIDDPISDWFNVVKKPISKWQDVLKWIPNEQYKPFKGYKTDSGSYDSLIHESLFEEDNRTHPVLVAGHYMFRGNERIKRDIDEYELHDWAKGIVASMDSLGEGGYWFYRKPTDDQAIMFSIVPDDRYLPQQSATSEEAKIKNKTKGDILVFTTIFPDKQKPKATWYDMWDEGTERNLAAKGRGMNKTVEQINKELQHLTNMNQKDRNTINFLTRQIKGQTKSQKKESERKINEARNRVNNRQKAIASLKEDLKNKE